MGAGERRAGCRLNESVKARLHAINEAGVTDGRIALRVRSHVQEQAPHSVLVVARDVEIRVQQHGVSERYVGRAGPLLEPVHVLGEVDNQIQPGV